MNLDLQQNESHKQNQAIANHRRLRKLSMKAFPTSANEVRDLAVDLVSHLSKSMADTRGRVEWTTRNLDALRSFGAPGYELQHFPPSGSNQKGAFLWDYVAYQQNSGILIAAETEFDSELGSLKTDFDKLLYVRSPIKLLIFWLPKDSPQIEATVNELSKYMESCDQYSPSEIYLLYCRTWQNEDGTSGDRVWWLQVEGEPTHRSVQGTVFEPVRLHNGD